MPNLRFPEFTEEWERCHLSDIADIIGGGTPNTSVSEYWGGNIQWFTPSEIGKEKYVSLSERTISDIGLKNSSAKILPQGAVLLSTRATIGECSITLNECTTNQGFQSLVAKINKVTSEFLYYLVSTIKKEMLRRSCGSTFLEISSSELKKIRV
ncbi:MAG TPA: restriction endonuclease subunit S, partial [Bacteroidales bacterium]|nr:restriction endonuclease subunit S [Bacteroidales bacterium]